MSILTANERESLAHHIGVIESITDHIPAGGPPTTPQERKRTQHVLNEQRTALRDCIVCFEQTREQMGETFYYKAMMMAHNLLSDFYKLSCLATGAEN